MFERIPSQNSQIVAHDAVGMITDDDYKSVLIPALDAAIAEHGHVRAMLRFGSKFEGYTPHAMMDDAAYGLSHLKDFHRIAVVSDVSWIRHGVGMFAHLSPVALRLFDADQTDAALSWLAED